MIAMHGITKSFGPQPVLRGIDLHVPRGSVLALLGPNGAGKTTLINILSTLLLPDTGTAIIGGHDVVRAPQAVRSTISLTGQFAAVDDLLTGDENLRLLGRLWHLPTVEAQARAKALLERFDLARDRQRLVKTYSGGMRRKLDLALSLLSQPQVLFLDEPTTGLDPRSRFALWDVVRDLAREGVTVFLTTQYLEEADQLADTVAMIHGGRIVAHDSPAALKQWIARPRATLELSDPAMVVRVTTLLGPGMVTAGTSPHTLVVDLEPGSESLRHLLNTLHQAGIQVNRVALQEPSLDDVFLNLTGEPVSHPEAA